MGLNKQQQDCLDIVQEFAEAARRAGLLAGLREAAGTADGIAAAFASSSNEPTEQAAALSVKYAILLRIAALEEEEAGR